VKLTFSPLVAGMSGKAADAVAATWKGVAYVRKHVIPKNPKSPGQVAQRGLLTRMPPWWRSLPAGLKTLVNSLAVGRKMSGYNLMVKTDLTILAAAGDPIIVPGNPDLHPVSLVAGANGSISGLKITWTQDLATTGNFAHIFTAPVDPDEESLTEPDVWTYQSDDIVTVETEEADDVPTANAAKDYYIAVVVADTNDLATATCVSGGTGGQGTSTA